MCVCVCACVCVCVCVCIRWGGGGSCIESYKISSCVGVNRKKKKEISYNNNLIPVALSLLNSSSAERYSTSPYCFNVTNFKFLFTYL